MSHYSISPPVWNWYCVFVDTMGPVISVALSAWTGILTVHWLHQLARSLERRPVPRRFWTAWLNINKMAALAVVVVMVSVGCMFLFYWLLHIASLLRPSPVVAPPDFEEFSDFGRAQAFIGSVSLYTLVAALVISVLGFLGLLFLAHRLPKTTNGCTEWFIQRYFRKSPFVGFLLIAIAALPLWNFLYDLSWLVFIVAPATRQFPTADLPSADARIRVSTYIALLLPILMFSPLVIMWVRTVIFGIRYRLVNPVMRHMFIQSMKWNLIGLLGIAGFKIVTYSADYILRMILRLAFTSASQ